MHKKLLNHARLRFAVAPRGPILVKSGVETPDPTRPGMEFVRTRHPRAGETVYLPGTSLKGVLRSQAERSLKGLDVKVCGVEICDPLDGGRRCKGQPSKKRNVTTADVYKAQCAACRTFGSLSVGGRLSVSDAYPWRSGADDDELMAAVKTANATERRDQVAIDRKTGATHGGGKFDLEVVVAGRFHAEVSLHNFQLWQLGLLAAVLQDVDDGFAAVGFGKARGLGQAAIEWHGLTIDTVSRQKERLLGVGALSPNGDREAYGLRDDDALDLPDSVGKPVDTWRGTRIEARDQGLEALLSAAVEGPLADLVGRPSGS